MFARLFKQHTKAPSLKTLTKYQQPKQTPQRTNTPYHTKPTTTRVRTTAQRSFTSSSSSSNLKLDRLNPRDVPPPNYLPTPAPFKVLGATTNIFARHRLINPLVDNSISVFLSKGPTIDTKGPVTRGILPDFDKKIISTGFRYLNRYDFGLQIGPTARSRSLAPNYPWYLVRSVHRRSLKYPAYDLISTARVLGPQSVFARPWFHNILIGLLFALLIHDTRQIMEMLNRTPSTILTESVVVTTISIVNKNIISTGNLMENRPWLSKMALSTLLSRSIQFGRSASTPDSAPEQLEKFDKDKHKILSSILFSFYRTPVTETIRAQLSENVLAKIDNESRRFVKADATTSNLTQPGLITIAQLMASPADGGIPYPTLLQQLVAENIRGNLDEKSYRENLFVELMVLANMRSGFESLLRHANAKAIAANPALINHTAANFRFLPSSLYRPVSDVSNLPESEAILMHNLSNIFQQTPIAHLANIISPDMQAALSSSVRYPSIFLEYASVMLNIKSVLQDTLPVQGQSPSLNKDPTPAAILATQQLIPSDLLAHYPVIQQDTLSLALSQTLLMTDLAIGQLLGEYYRVTPNLPQATPTVQPTIKTYQQHNMTHQLPQPIISQPQSQQIDSPQQQHLLQQQQQQLLQPAHFPPPTYAPQYQQQEQPMATITIDDNQKISVSRDSQHQQREY